MGLYPYFSIIVLQWLIKSFCSFFVAFFFGCWIDSFPSSIRFMWVAVSMNEYSMGFLGSVELNLQLRINRL